jgi:hypothetical protein
MKVQLLQCYVVAALCMSGMPPRFLELLPKSPQVLASSSPKQRRLQNEERLNVKIIAADAARLGGQDRGWAGGV